MTDVEMLGGGRAPPPLNFKEGEMKIDPEFRNLIPPLTEEEYSSLEVSIMAEGCRDAIVCWDDLIVDGNNRFEICQKHNLKFKTLDKAFDNRDEAKIWIITN
jgi:hypothetical protein